MLLVVALAAPAAYADDGGGSWWQTVVEWMADALGGGPADSDADDGEMGPMLQPGG